MTLKERAMMLEQLGKLMKTLALTQGQFKSVKALILKDDPRVSVELFSTLTVFREQRAAGILTDQEYDDLVSEGLEDLLIDDAPSSPNALAKASSVHQSSKRKRYEAGEQGRPGGRKRQNDPRKSSGSRPSTERSPIQVGHQEPMNSSQGLQERSVSELQNIDGREILRSHASESDKPDEQLDGDGDYQNAHRCSTVSKSGSNNVHSSATSDDLLCFRRQRWTRTNPFILPHISGFSTDEGPFSVVDSTVDLLEKAKQRAFPLYLGCNKNLKGAPSKISFVHQRIMYCKLKKVLIRQGEIGDERAIYRATDEEVEKEVDDVSGKKISVEDYLCGVKKLRAAQQVSKNILEVGGEESP